MKPLQAAAIVMVVCGLCAGCAVTTPRVTEQDINSRMALDRKVMYENQEPLGATITLEEAMARAIKYNLDHRLKLMEDALALKQMDLMAYDMLPRLVAAAGYTERDSYNASSSMNVNTHQESLAESTSQDKGHFNADLTLTWNVLDFGVSYFQAKQQADRTHIMKERRRKVVHSIMQQVRYAYWLALGAQQLEGRFEPLLQEVEKALQDSFSIEQEKLRPPVETLLYRKTLLEIIKQLETFRDEMSQAKPRLAALLNLPLGHSFSLKPLDLKMLELTIKLDEMENKALFQRPELMEADYNERITVYETRKAIARMLPGIELTTGGHYDSNSFLVDNYWIDGGVRLTWNLLNLITGSSQYKIATSQVEISQSQRLALSMAVLTQVHVAYHDFYSRKRQYALAEQLQDLDSRIYEQTVNQTKSGSQSHLNEIRSATAALMAEYRTYQNYASLQNSCGQIKATLGEDPLPETITSHEIQALANEINTWLYGPGALCIPVKTTAVPVTRPAPAAATQEVPAAALPAPSLTLSIIPDTITRGQTANLAWVSQNALKCLIKPGNEMVTPQGDKEVSPSKTTIYTVTCEGPGGTTTETSTLIVADPVKTAAALNVSALELCKPTILSLQFDTAKWDIKPEHHAVINGLADFLFRFPKATGEISGHTDNIPFADQRMDNTQLAKNRADSIRNYLINTFGIDPNRISAMGYGPDKPIADNSTKEGRQKNRRIETNFKCDQN